MNTHGLGGAFKRFQKHAASLFSRSRTFSASGCLSNGEGASRRSQTWRRKSQQNPDGTLLSLLAGVAHTETLALFEASELVVSHACPRRASPHRLGDFLEFVPRRLDAAHVRMVLARKVCGKRLDVLSSARRHAECRVEILKVHCKRPLVPMSGAWRPLQLAVSMLRA